MMNKAKQKLFDKDVAVLIKHKIVEEKNDHYRLAQSFRERRVVTMRKLADKSPKDFDLKSFNNFRELLEAANMLIILGKINKSVRDTVLDRYLGLIEILDADYLKMIREMYAVGK